MEQTKKKTKVAYLSKRRDSILFSLTILVVAFVWLLISTVVKTVEVTSDINNAQYIQVEAYYERGETSLSDRLWSNGKARITANGDELTLELPHGWTEKLFPKESCYAKVWYSKESKIILSVIPTEEP